MPFWFRYLALASAERLFSTIPKTLSCSTSFCAAVTLRAGSPASSSTVNEILRLPSSPLEFARSKRARIPFSESENDGALGPLWGRIAPTLISVALTPGSFVHELGALTRFGFWYWPEPPPPPPVAALAV